MNSRFRLEWLAIVFCISILPAACSRKNSPESPTPTVTPTPVLSLSQPLSGKAESASLAGAIAAADQVKAKAEAGDVTAECDLGMRYLRGNGVPKDYSEAVKWLRKAADQGNIEAEASMGVCYEFGYGVEKEDSLAAGWYSKAAQLNNASAQHHLGTAYMQGRGVRKDVVEGYKWILLAAAQGEPFALKNVTKYASGLTSSQLAQAKGLVDAFRAADLSSLTSSTAAADQVKAKAESGDATAECDLGMRYLRGNGVPKDYSEALKWLRKAADQDYAEAQRELGSIYFYGYGVQKDYAQAFAWYGKAAAQGDIAAEANMGLCYSFGYGVDKEDSLAAGWYLKAAQLNNALAQNNLGAAYMQGRGVRKDVVEGYKWILLAAAQGYKPAQQNVTKHESRLTLSQLAQAKGLVDAFHAADLSGPATPIPPLPTPSTARSIADNGTPKPSGNSSLAPLPTVPPAAPPPVERAPMSIQERAEAGDAEAQCQLGLCYVNGNGVAKNVSEAVKWLRKAAEQNNAVAEYNLGVLCSTGRGTTKNMVEACRWFLKAAEQNNSDAEYNLGFYYMRGEGVRKNAAEACKWFYKAAQQNVGDAQTNLGYCYMEGVGVRRDDVQAYKWCALAAAKGDGSARDNLAILESRMSRSAIVQGRALVREFAPGEGAAPEGGSQDVPAAGGGSQSQNGPLKAHNTGTGFFVTDDGYLMTNFHVVKDGAAVQLLTIHAKVSARVVKVDATNDLALLKAEGVFVALPVGSSVGVKLGDTVSTVGFPFPDLQGVTPKFTRGEINSLAGAKDDGRFFQMSTQIQPGNSGGALVDEHGNVVGVTSSQLNSYVLKNYGQAAENVNYAIKSNLVLSFLRSALDTPDKLKSPNTDENKPADLIDRMQQAAAMVVVYWHSEK